MSLDWDKIDRYDTVEWFKITWVYNVWTECNVDEMRIFLCLVVCFGDNVDISTQSIQHWSCVRCIGSVLRGLSWLCYNFIWKICSCESWKKFYVCSCGG